MANPKDVLVVTTTSVNGLKVKKYLKPVSAHVVAGTNLFSDFFAGLSDIFGGRSESYQKQLISLYNEAIEQVKYSAYEIGANCIVGLQIDMDEIAGKGKSMFMLTALGTAVILEKDIVKSNIVSSISEGLENVSVERINVLRKRKAIINKTNADNLTLNDDIWDFITVNQVDEVFPFLLKKLEEKVEKEQISEFYRSKAEAFYKLFVTYIDSLPEQKKVSLLYNSICEKSGSIALKLTFIIKELYLFDFKKIMELLKSDSFQTKKLGLRVATFDKPFFNKQDIQDLLVLQKFIRETFPERGSRTMKKKLLSSKEIEVWLCECGKTNEIGTYCSDCKLDINGFKKDELKPTSVDTYIGQKIELILEYLK